MLFVEFVIAHPSVLVVAPVLALVTAFFFGREFEATHRVMRWVAAWEVAYTVTVVHHKVPRNWMTEPHTIPVENPLTTLLDRALIAEAEVEYLREQLDQANHRATLHNNTVRIERARSAAFVEAFADPEFDLEDLTTQTIKVITPKGQPDKRVPLLTPALAHKVEEWV